MPNLIFKLLLSWPNPNSKSAYTEWRIYQNRHDYSFCGVLNGVVDELIFREDLSALVAVVANLFPKQANELYNLLDALGEKRTKGECNNNHVC